MLDLVRTLNIWCCSHSQKILIFSVFWLWLPIGDYGERLSKRLKTGHVRGSRHRKHTMKISTWKNIVVGTSINLEQAMKSSGYEITTGALEVLRSKEFSLSPVKREIELVRVTPKMLGIGDRAEFRFIFNAALEHGFKACPDEVGPQLCLQYPNLSDENPGEMMTLTMGMDWGRFWDGCGDRVFDIRVRHFHKDSRQLYTRRTVTGAHMGSVKHWYFIFER